MRFPVLCGFHLIAAARYVRVSGILIDRKIAEADIRYRLAEIVRDLVHQIAVACPVRSYAAVFEVCIDDDFLEFVYLFTQPRHHASRRPVVRADHHAVCQHAAHLSRAFRDIDHRALRQCLDELRSDPEHPRSIFHRQDPRDHCRRVFAIAVTCHRVRLYSESRQRVRLGALYREYQLQSVYVVHLVCRTFQESFADPVRSGSLARVHHAVHLRSENAAAPVKLSRRLDIEAARSGEHEHGPLSCKFRSVVRSPRCDDSLPAPVRYRECSVLQHAPAALERVCRVIESHVVFGHICCDIFRYLFRSFLRSSAVYEQVRLCLFLAALYVFHAFPKDCHRVRAAHAYRTADCDPLAVAFPFLRLRADGYRAARRLQLVCRFTVVYGRDESPVLEHKRGLDHVRHACRHVRMSYIGLHRTYLQRSRAVDILQHPRLDRIAQLRGCAVRLVVSDFVFADLGNSQHAPHALLLSENARCCKARLAAAVIVHERALYDCHYVVVIRHRILISLQYHYPCRRSRHQAVGFFIERSYHSCSRLCRQVRRIAFLSQLSRHTSGDRHVALEIEQRLACLVDSIERGRARVLAHHRRASEVELVCDLLGSGGDMHLVQLVCVEPVFSAVYYVVPHIRTVVKADVQPRSPPERETVVARVFQCVVCKLHHDPLFRIGISRFRRRYPEKSGLHL